MKFFPVFTKAAVLAMATSVMATSENKCKYIEIQEAALCIKGDEELFCSGNNDQNYCDDGMFQGMDEEASEKNEDSCKEKKEGDGCKQSFCCYVPPPQNP
ncbi:hypothetical protein QTJ16_006672 [Diplocarpon rosae]|uniref:Plethodontid modulating factor n=1 Tax=Diplocarpon rosae TaxID=946125 RepID=A0AAD9SSV3_9HELO|nr:hypothetical protein QTJ16_006672 [Diplocarpon rosae]